MRTVAPPAPPPAPAPPPQQPPEASTKVAVAPPPARTQPARPAPAATPEAPAAAAPAPEPPPPAPPPKSPPSIEGATLLPPNVPSVPEPAHIHYEVVARRGFLSLAGRARLDWQHDGKQYEARMEASSPGLPTRVQRSTGRITEDGLVPEYFSDKGARSEQATHFDRANGRVVFSNNRPQAPIVEGMQDSLSVVVQLSMLVAGDPARFQPGTRVAVPTANTREADTWIFNVEGEEELQLPGGQVRAIKLQRLPRREFDQKVELWLAPRLDYAPVRLRLTNPNGDTVDQRWSSTDKG
jgi:hypothetical protein